MVAHAFNLSTQEDLCDLCMSLWQADLCEFEASLVYRVSSRTAKTTHRETLSWNQTNKQKEYSIYENIKTL